MAEIPTFTAQTSRSRNVYADISVDAATAPYRALGNVGDSISRLGGTLADINEQRSREKELRWAGDKADELSRTLIEWQRENQGREDIGEAYREFADKQVAEHEAGAPTPRAAGVFRRSVLPAINREWEQNLRLGETTRFENFKVAERKSSITANDNYRERFGLNPVTAQLIRHLDLQTQLARIDGAYGKAAPKVAAALKETAVVDAVTGAMERDPALAGEILEQYPHVDAETRRILMGRLEVAQHQNNTAQIVTVEQSFRDSLADGITGNTAVSKPAFAKFKGLFSTEGAYAQFENRWNEEFEVHNKTVGVLKDVDAMNPAARNAAIASAASTMSGEIGLKVRTALARADKALDDEFAADPAGAVTRHNEDLNALRNNAARSRAQASSGNPMAVAEADAAEQTWRKAMWDRQGYAPPLSKIPVMPSRRQVIAGRAIDPIKEQQAAAKTYQNLPTSERRILTKEEAEAFGSQLTSGSWQERLDAVKVLKQKFPDPHPFGVALKDIEQLNPGKQDLIQRITLAAHHETRNPALSTFIASGNGRESWKAINEEQRGKIRDALDLRFREKNAEWSTFALAARGATGEHQDTVAGIRQIVEEQAAFTLPSKNNATEAVKAALDTVLFKTFAVPVMAPAYESSPANPLVIGREILDPQTGKSDPRFGLRTDGEVAEIASLTAYSKVKLKPDDVALFDPSGNPYYLNSIPWLYTTLKEPTLTEALKDRLKREIMQKGFFVSDPDYQGATLYMLGENGLAFAPVLKTGRPFHFRFHDIPGKDIKRNTVDEIPGTIY